MVLSGSSGYDADNLADIFGIETITHREHPTLLVQKNLDQLAVSLFLQFLDQVQVILVSTAQS